MSSLSQYGWNSHFEQHYTSFFNQGLEAGRVTAINGFNHTIISNNGSSAAILAGALMNSKETWELPKVGDWVVFKPYDDQCIILDVLPRQNAISRKLPGKSSQQQVIAANIDAALIIQGLDRDFNLQRLQRYLQQVYQCGIQPVVVLNKQDLVDDPEAYRQQVVDLGYNCPVLLTSALDHQQLNSWTSQYLQAGKTFALLGSSGVGKSTLFNALSGQAIQKEGSLSTFNNKGQHTTTARHLTVLPNGSMLIDSPGMREFGLTIDADEGVNFHHPQIEELSAKCRFRDCTHQQEPGCAVTDAVEAGTLPMAVYRNYLKLIREQYHYQASAMEKKRMEQQFGKLSKQVNALRKKRKY
ncbi:ribosome small subunit-dependent GTPase A [Chitinophaga filiformis]|uniref:ribosome small subunit-dependent GTPase A n=1 Tax=Chitinophaga filiformis TaxID=104663 RepID=UPI001F3699A4|nr:ribosome small subunit-dependent GTPase A [Chitinophaga filiformis]MCF6406914.1 ribosome small subunit-dependent GTPase A [Chitinophaga filiformis]